MKKGRVFLISFIVLIFIFSLNSAFAAVFSNSLQDGLMGFWNFGSTSSSTSLKDANGIYNLTGYNGPAIVSGTGEFDGNDYYAKALDTFTELYLKNFSVVSFVNLASFPQQGIAERYTILTTYDNQDHGTTGTWEGITLGFYTPTASTHYLRCAFETGGESGGEGNVDFNLLVDNSILNKMVHIACTYNSQIGEMKIYINGTLAGTKIISYSDSNLQCGPASLGFTQRCYPSPPNRLFIGAQLSDPAYPQYLVGTIDDVGIWNRVLTPLEILNLSGGNPPVIPPVSPTSSLNKPYWASPSNSLASITNTNLNDTVLMMVPGVNISNQSITYEIYKESSLFFGLIKWSTLSETSLTSNLWVANETGNFYFKAKIGTIENTSDILVVGAYDNTLPVVVINKPVNNHYTAINCPVNFNQSSYDVDDLLNLSWDFGDNTRFSVKDYTLALTPKLADTLHSYTSAGAYNIVLTALEQRANSRAISDTRTIQVFKDGINVIPIISSPKDDILYGNFVSFNASQSFVAQCGYNALVSGGFTTGCGLNCTYIHAPNTQTYSGYSLVVNWTVYTGFNNAFDFSRVGEWKNNYSSVVDFMRFYDQANPHHAKLTLTYN